jgi:hypothetical protein
MSFLSKTKLVLGTLTRSLGEKMLYRHANGGTVEIVATWNREYQFIDPETETPVSSFNPHIGVRLSDLIESPQEGDTVEFQNNVYRVQDVEEDGQGAAQLMLYKL